MTRPTGSNNRNVKLTRKGRSMLRATEERVALTARGRALLEAHEKRAGRARG